ncbi:hypothetical protein D3C85_584540 [compost metagenome]
MSDGFTVTRYGTDVDLSYEHKTACPKCRRHGKDRSGNNLHCYGKDGEGRHRGATCFACEFRIPSQEYIDKIKENSEEDFEIVGSHFDEEVNAKLKTITGVDSKNYRGVRTDISKPFGVRYEYSQEDAGVVATYYPCTQDSELVGYKVRRHPKDFSSPIGETGRNCEMFGQFKFKTFANTVLIVGGEHDCLAAFQMLSDSQKNKQFNPVAVVSPTIGESGAHKQVQSQYKFFEGFSSIVVCMDSDKAGEEAAEKVAKVLPRSKVKIMKMRYKDPNQYIEKGKEQEFINDFWASKTWTPSGVHASSSLYDAALNYTNVERLTLPPFLGKASEMFGGGWVKNELSVIFAQTSQGKSLFVDSCVTHWVMNETKEVVGVMSLEATKDKYATNIISRYLGVNLNSMQGQDRLDYLSRPEVKESISKFLVRPDNTDRFFVYDSRGAGIEDVKASILEMVIQLGVTLLVADPYSDLTMGMDLSAQEEFVAWLKKLILEYPQLSVVLICHTRKVQGGQAALTESDIIGSSTVMKSAAQTISIERDKLHENPILRNVSKVTIHKNRHASDTGLACEVYFDKSTGTLHDWVEYQDQHPEIASLISEYDEGLQVKV